VQASNGHDTPVIYALAAGPGATERERGVWRGTVAAASGKVEKTGWKRMSDGLRGAISLVACAPRGRSGVVPRRRHELDSAAGDRADRCPDERVL